MNMPAAPAPPPPPVRASTLAPYKAANGDIVLPGSYGVSHGAGITGELIRHATESWAGHAFVYIGNNQIVEGAPPVARIASAASHTDAVWNVRYPLTDDQRDKICARAHALVGCPYDYPGLHRLCAGGTEYPHRQGTRRGIQGRPLAGVLSACRGLL